MILTFDLDDTLYAERTYVDSGFRAVARWLEQRHGWDADASFATMTAVLEKEGRGQVFDRVLAQGGVHGKTAVADCVKAYRQHTPSISLYPSAEALLDRLHKPLYIVTDGHKGVQTRKVQALGLEPRFSKIFVTHHYGIHNAKPSIHCFERIRERERCAWTDMVYVGDNPAKDFVNLTPLGVRTVRVLTGGHRSVKARPGFDATHVIEDLSELSRVIPEIDGDRPRSNTR